MINHLWLWRLLLPLAADDVIVVDCSCMCAHIIVHWIVYMIIRCCQFWTQTCRHTICVTFGWFFSFILFDGSFSALKLNAFEIVLENSSTITVDSTMEKNALKKLTISAQSERESERKTQNDKRYWFFNFAPELFSIASSFRVQLVRLSFVLILFLFFILFRCFFRLSTLDILCSSLSNVIFILRLRHYHCGIIARQFRKRRIDEQNKLMMIDWRCAQK